MAMFHFQNILQDIHGQTKKVQKTFSPVQANEPVVTNKGNEKHRTSSTKTYIFPKKMLKINYRVDNRKQQPRQKYITWVHQRLNAAKN